MANLDTITLSELDTVDELLETDTLLVERGGRVKRFTGEVGSGGGFCIINLDNYTPDEEGSDEGGSDEGGAGK